MKQLSAKKGQKGFTLVEAVIATLLLAIMTGLLFTVNATFVNNMAHGLQTAHAQEQALNVQAAMKSLAQEATNIWITPLLKSGEQVWMTGSATGTDNVEAGLDRSNLSELTVTDLAAVDTYLYTASGVETLSFASTTALTYLYPPEMLKRGYLVWFNCKKNDGTTEVRGVIEVKLLGPSSYGSSSYVSATENAATTYPRVGRTSDSIRVTLFLGSDLMSQLTGIQLALADLDALAPNSPYYAFTGNRVSREVSSNPNNIVIEDSAVTTSGGSTPVFSASSLKPVAAYVVDYKQTAPVTSFWDVASVPLAAKDKHPSQYILYTSFAMLPNTFGAIMFKLPSPQDHLAMDVPKTLGFVGSIWGSNNALAGAKDLGIDRAIMFTIYPNLSE